jgi:parvulin-like peptidyl-prolyl isomerase
MRMKRFLRPSVMHGCMVVLLASGCQSGRDTGAALKPSETDRSFRTALAGDKQRQGDFRRDGLMTEPVLASGVAQPTVAAAPQVAPAPGSAPQFVQMGAVISEVNGKPIYAHTVLKLIAPSLKPAALQMDDFRFQRRAREEIRRMRDELKRDELTYALADRELTSDEKRIVDMIAGKHYDDLITEAGGSVALARQKADTDEDGRSFEEELEQYRRQATVGIHENRRLSPRAKASVDEMRSYYIRNRAEYTKPANAKFKVVRIDIEQVGGDDAARAKAEDVRARAIKGEDFASIAAEANSDQKMRDARGQIPSLVRGTFSVPEVEAAVWATEIGKPTPVIKAGKSYYVALPEDKNAEVVRPFEDAELQESIRRQIEKEKLVALRMQKNEQLIADATVRETDEQLEAAVAMAMQLYRQWRAEAGK